MLDFITETGIFIVSLAVLVGLYVISGTGTLLVKNQVDSSQNSSSSANYAISKDVVTYEQSSSSSSVSPAVSPTKKTPASVIKKVVVPIKRAESDDDSGRSGDE